MATFGAKYNDGPWRREPSVHKIKGGDSHAPHGGNRTGSLKATPAQLRYLADLGYDGDLDLTRLEASDAIEIWKRRKRQT